MLRAIAAGLFVFVGVMGMVAVLGASGRLEGREWWPAAAIVCAGAGLTIAAMYLFNPRGERWLVRAPSLSELERHGLVVDAAFQVTRAFGVEEFDDDPELRQPRRFPCAAFTLRRHRTGD